MVHYQQLKTIFKWLSHLAYTKRIMQWDEAVMMPEGAGAARASALATLSRFSQKILISKQTKILIEQAKTQGVYLHGIWKFCTFKSLVKR